MYFIEDNGTITSIYSGRNRLISTQSTLAPTLYQYNAFGERVSKQSAAQILFAYDEDGHLVGEYQSNGDLIQETIWLDDTPIATIRPSVESHNGQIAGNIKVFFIQPDHLDSPRTIVDNNNQAIWQWHSDPFGKELANADVDGDSVDFAFNLRFPGQYFDIETDTHYNYFRDYESETGRYLQSDPIGLGDDLSTYRYVGGDSIGYFDPSGEARNGYKKPKKKKNCKRRPYQRKSAVKGVWNAAEDGSPNKKICSTCDKNVEGNPNDNELRNGTDGWDVDHIQHWKEVLAGLQSKGASSKEIRDAYNDIDNLRLRCRNCNRSDNQ